MRRRHRCDRVPSPMVGSSRPRVGNISSQAVTVSPSLRQRYGRRVGSRRTRVGSRRRKRTEPMKSNGAGSNGCRVDRSWSSFVLCALVSRMKWGDCRKLWRLRNRGRRHCCRLWRWKPASASGSKASLTMCGGIIVIYGAAGDSKRRPSISSRIGDLVPAHFSFRPSVIESRSFASVDSSFDGDPFTGPLVPRSGLRMYR